MYHFLDSKTKQSKQGEKTLKNWKGFPVRMKCGPFLTLETWFFLIRLHQRQIALSKKFRNACFLNEGQKKDVFQGEICHSPIEKFRSFL